MGWIGREEDKKKASSPQMGISLKTDMQMLGLSNPKMFSFFLRTVAYGLLEIWGKEGASVVGGGVWERAGGGTCQVSGARGQPPSVLGMEASLLSPSGCARLELKPDAPALTQVP